MQFGLRDPDMAGMFDHHGGFRAVNQARNSQDPATITPLSVRCWLIRRARQAKGLSQRELGQRVGLPQSRISQIETGDADLDAEILPQIAAELSIAGQAQQRLLVEFPEQRWRQWVWHSRYSPSEKLVLLALLDSAAEGADFDRLQAATGLTAGTVRALIAALTDEGLLRTVPGGCGQAPKVAFAACIMDEAA